MGAFEFTAAILCDDIRKEVNNKEILIGVYTGDIVVPSFPAWIPLAVWVEATAKALGPQEEVFRLTVLDNKPPITVKAGVRVEKLGSLSMAISGLQILLEKEGSVVLEVKVGDEWRVLKSKEVILGAVSGTVPTLAVGN